MSEDLQKAFDTIRRSKPYGIPAECGWGVFECSEGINCRCMSLARKLLSSDGTVLIPAGATIIRRANAEDFLTDPARLILYQDKGGNERWIRYDFKTDRKPCPVCGSGDWSCGH
jgi:hypothetical protein